MPAVRLPDPATLNVLGWFVAGVLRKNLEERGLECTLDGVLEVEADGMRAAVEFRDGGAVVSRAGPRPKARITGTLADLAAAIGGRSFRALWKVRVRGSRFFVMRALRYLKP